MCSYSENNFLYDNAIPILAIIAAVCIGIFQIKLMNRQNIINENTIRLGLFDKRFNVFNSIKDILRKILMDGFINLEDLHGFIREKKPVSEFLFDNDIPDFIDTIFQKSILLNSLIPNQLTPQFESPQQRLERETKKSEVMVWFLNEQNNLENRFDKYFDFKDFKKL